MSRAPRIPDQRLPIEEQILEKAVARVVRNCRIALATRKRFTRDDAMTLLHPVNVACLESAAVSADLVASS